MGKWGLADKVLCVAAVCFVVAAGVVVYRHRCDRIVVYDLTWRAVQDNGGEVYMKWRYFIDYRSKLPVRIEKYSTTDPNCGYALKEVLVID